MDPMPREASGQPSRRKILKAAAASGLVAGGIAGLGGSASAQRGAVIDVSDEIFVSDLQHTNDFDDVEAAQEGTTFQKAQLRIEEVNDSTGEFTGQLSGVVKEVGGRAYRFSESVTGTAEPQDGGVSAQQAGGGQECPEETEIIGINIQPIYINILGLIVDIEEIDIEICCDPEGGLLGQLLCGIAGLP